MKKTKIVIPALGLLLLSTAASVTGTVAWFSANTSVNVNGMAVTTKVSGNLLIAEDNSSDDNYSAADLTQGVEGILEPVSTIDGVDFYYTKDDVKGSGAATSGESEFKLYNPSAAASSEGQTAGYSKEFEEYYEVKTAVGYVDYVFYLKATSSAANQKVILSKANLKYNNAAITSSEKAWRTAVFCETVAQGAAGSDAVVGNNKTILALTGAANFSTGEAVDDIDTNNHASMGSVLHPGSAAELGTLATAGLTQRYKVIVRMWLEGEDTTCNNETFATLTKAYTLDLSVKLVDSDNTEAVKVLSSN